MMFLLTIISYNIQDTAGDNLDKWWVKGFLSGVPITRKGNEFASSPLHLLMHCMKCFLFFSFFFTTKTLSITRSD